MLDAQPASLGYDATVTFFNHGKDFRYRAPAGAIDLESGVICSPNNFLYGAGEGQLTDGVIRITSLAHFDRWQNLSEEQYRLEKLRWYDRMVASAVRSRG